MNVVLSSELYKGFLDFVDKDNIDSVINSILLLKLKEAYQLGKLVVKLEFDMNESIESGDNDEK